MGEDVLGKANNVTGLTAGIYRIKDMMSDGTAAALYFTPNFAVHYSPAAAENWDLYK